VFTRSHVKGNLDSQPNSHDFTVFDSILFFCSSGDAWWSNRTCTARKETKTNYNQLTDGNKGGTRSLPVGWWWEREEAKREGAAGGVGVCGETQVRYRGGWSMLCFNLLYCSFLTVLFVYLPVHLCREHQSSKGWPTACGLRSAAGPHPTDTQRSKAWSQERWSHWNITSVSLERHRPLLIRKEKDRKRREREQTNKRKETVPGSWQRKDERCSFSVRFFLRF
jgi:hypothetical protein